MTPLWPVKTVKLDGPLVAGRAGKMRLMLDLRSRSEGVSFRDGAGGSAVPGGSSDCSDGCCCCMFSQNSKMDGRPLETTPETPRAGNSRRLPYLESFFKILDTDPPMVADGFLRALLWPLLTPLLVSSS